MLKTGFAREVITPDVGAPLCGYFNLRPNRGALDDLFVKVLLFECNNVITGLVTYDLCFISREIIAEIREQIKELGIEFANNLLFSATHTHTGPYTVELCGHDRNEEYAELAVQQTVQAITRALNNLQDSHISVGSVNDNPFGFNRRYWMHDGKVVTNPGKLNPHIVEPEGPMDDEISVVAIKQDDRIVALVANIINHTDTIGGDLVSADWPGRMERAIQNQLGNDVPVLTLVGCSGNINHFDVSTNMNQASYKETCRIGQGYADTICEMLDDLEKIKFSAISADIQDINISFQNISDKQVSQAEIVISATEGLSSDDDLTSEDLAAGNGLAARFFAEQLLDYKQHCSGKSRVFQLVSLKFGNVLAITSLPGEPFTEIGLEIKAGSPFEHTLVAALGMGECGYVCMPECYNQGGYEILPVQNGGPHQDTAKLLIKASLENLSNR
jgi:hypothetical protein